jgi:L-methionine (R)-S-oxide reductase
LTLPALDLSPILQTLFYGGHHLNNNSTKLLQNLAALILGVPNVAAALKEAAEMIREKRHYRWVGIYKVTRHECVIVTGTGSEPPTYRRFPVTQGLCGAVAESRETLIVGDVKKDPRYLPTFWTTRSEIVVPIISESTDRVVGVIDAESDKLNAFTDEDRDFLEHVAVLMARALCTGKKKQQQQHDAPAH